MRVGALVGAPQPVDRDEPDPDVRQHHDGTGVQGRAEDVAAGRQPADVARDRREQLRRAAAAQHRKQVGQGATRLARAW